MNLLFHRNPAFGRSAISSSIDSKLLNESQYAPPASLQSGNVQWEAIALFALPIR